MKKSVFTLLMLVAVATAYAQESRTDREIDERFAAADKNKDAKLYAGTFNGTQHAMLAMDPSRKAYVHLIKGALTVNGQHLSGGDAAMIANESRIEIGQGKEAEVLVFDLA